VVSRGVIVNADDFGQSAGINRGVIEAHEHGIVTSASLMVRGVAASEAATYARARTGFSIGLHVDLYEWSREQGEWICLYDRVDNGEAAAVAKEIGEQIECFRDLLGRDPTHIDSHQHVHKADPARTILIERATTLGVPLRHFSPLVRHTGEFCGQAPDGRTIPGNITASHLAALLRGLPPGVTELGCHPGYADDVSTMYRHERVVEVQALCAAEVRRVFEETNVRLISFLDVSWVFSVSR
jgi:predicted glycoside hydrolase/deacetylase ChbG (UPF0249 family)